MFKNFLTDELQKINENFPLIFFLNLRIFWDIFFLQPSEIRNDNENKNF